MKYKIIAVLLAMPPFIQQCGNGDVTSRDGPRSILRREIAVTDTLWSIEQGFADTLLLYPYPDIALDPERNRLYVLDNGSYRVSAFALRTGELLWTAGGRGEGPGEFRGLRRIEIDADGNTIIYDHKLRRFSVFDVDGRLQNTMIPSFGYLDDFCVIHSGILGLHLGRPSVLLEFSESGIILGRHAIPWESKAALLDQAVMNGQSITSRCIIAQSLGNRMYVYTDDQARFGTLNYVEDYTPPRVETEVSANTRVEQVTEHRLAARAVSLSDNEAAVLFGGGSNRAGRVVDIYQLDTGSYVHSVSFSALVHGMAYANGILIVTYYKDGYPAMMAVRIYDNARNGAT